MEQVAGHNKQESLCEYNEWYVTTIAYLKGKHYREVGETMIIELSLAFVLEDAAQPDNSICLDVASGD